MPYADNLYSGDDSEAESFSEELSPTDGYFTNRVVPPTAMVADPSLADDGATDGASKAQEAREEAQADVESRSFSRETPPESQQTTSPRSTSSAFADSAQFGTYNALSTPAFSPRGSGSILGHAREAYSENTPLLNSIPPPPAYSAAAPSSPSQPSFPPSSSSYRTLTDHELEQGIPAHREPESMGGPNDLNDRTPLWRSRISKIPPWRRLIKHILLVALIFSLVVSFIIGTIKFSRHTALPKNPSNKPSLPSPDMPATGHGRFCSAATIHVQDSLPTYEFHSGERLGILQVNSDSAMPQGPNHIYTLGQINLQRLPADSKDPTTGLITFDAWVSHPGISVEVEMDPDSQSLRVGTPRSTTLSHSEKLCISLEINVWLPDGASFESLQTWTSDLSIKVSDDVNVDISGCGLFQTFHGSVRFPTLNDTELVQRGYIETSAGSLSNSDKELEDHDPIPDEQEIIDLDAALAEAYSSHSPYPPGLQPPSPPEPPTPPEAPAPPSPPSPPTFPTSPFDRHGDEDSDTSRIGSSGLRSREIFVETASGSISGSYHLFDILEITSQSGSVNVHVVPEPVLKTDPKPARLRIETMSGSIKAYNPVYNNASIYVRDYRTRVTSISGSIRGSFILGTEAFFKTVSGSLKLVSLPDAITQPAIFTTECTSGATQIEVLDPLLDRDPHQKTIEAPDTEIGDGDPYLLIPDKSEHVQDEASISRPIPTALRKLKSKHEAKSGSLKIHYPSAWEGQIDAQTISGSIRVGGKGVRTIKDNRRNWAYREVVARKGSDATHASTLNVDGISGSEQIWVGEGCTDDNSWCKS